MTLHYFAAKVGKIAVDISAGNSIALLKSIAPKSGQLMMPVLSSFKERRANVSHERA
jgi:hypothetical protein